MSEQVELSCFIPHGVGVRIAGLGVALGQRAISNDELAKLGAPLTGAEIERLSGIKQRFWVDDDTATSDLATTAALSAIGRSQVDKDALRRLVVATVSPDHTSPASACFVQQKLALPRVPAYDLTASCSGFVFALDAVARAIATGDMHGLAIAADVRSRFLNIADRATCALFGDGAAAAVLSRCEPGIGIEAIGLLTDGKGARSVYVPAGGSREPLDASTIERRRNSIHMDSGPQVYFDAVEGMIEATRAILRAIGRSLDEVALIVPHQPNRRILERYAKVMGWQMERMHVTVDRYGNTSGASVGIALDDALRTRALRAGDRVLLVTAGAGYTVGAASFVLDEALLSRSSG